ANAVIRKTAIGRHLLDQADFRRPQRNGQKGGDVRRDPKTMRRRNYLADSDMLRQLQRRNVQRIRKGPRQRDISQPAMFVIVRNVEARRGTERGWPIENDTVRLVPAFHRRSVVISLKR